jgi:hypothetical protein
MSGYEITNLIINFFTAIGTCGAVGVALWLSIPKKEKAEGYFKIDFHHGAGTIVYFSIHNIGDKNIRIDPTMGMYFKSKDSNDAYYTPMDCDRWIAIPRKTKRNCSITAYFGQSNIDNAKHIYEEKSSIICLYTFDGTEIELTKKEINF